MIKVQRNVHVSKTFLYKQNIKTNLQFSSINSLPREVDLSFIPLKNKKHTGFRVSKVSQTIRRSLLSPKPRTENKLIKTTKVGNLRAAINVPSATRLPRMMSLGILTGRAERRIHSVTSSVATLSLTAEDRREKRTLDIFCFVFLR